MALCVKPSYARAGAAALLVHNKQGSSGTSDLVGPVHLELNAHLAAGLVLAGGRIHQGSILIIGVVLCHHDIQHHTRVGDLQVFALLGLELHRQVLKFCHYQVDCVCWAEPWKCVQ